MSYSVVPVQPEHIEELAVTMRAADVAELDDLGFKPLDALQQSLRGSTHYFTALAHGRVLSVFGVRPLSLVGREGFPWALFAETTPKHSRAIHIYSTTWLNHIKGEFDWLHNYVSPRNVVAIRWLKRLGFEVSDVLTPFGPKLTPMRHFEMRL